MLKKEVVVEVLVLKKQGLSVREISRRLRIHRKTVKKYLEHQELIGRYVMKKPRRSKLMGFMGSIELKHFSKSQESKECEYLKWLEQLIREPQTISWSEKMSLKSQDTTELLSKLANGSLKEWEKALAILGRFRGIPLRTLCFVLDTSQSTVARYWKHYKKAGIKGLFQKRTQRVSKVDNEAIKEAVFSMIHSPPSDYNINRTSWKLEDLSRCLSQKGIHVSKNVISKIIRRAGYKYRKAKVVLTSNDPEYRQKLNRIKSILSKLGENDRFCSIDEFGPFAVKVKGGKRLVGPTEYPHVPQFQKSKVCLIVIAALELSQNQVTHFYSKTKNTTEMIKLLGILLEKHRGCNRLYFSWDAASWHASKALHKKVEAVNLPDYREKKLTPFVELVPLPKSAQFLNVIESVFSGMARAIIHNSDYESVEKAMMAIDLYFQERNDNFSSHPKKAGKKIWGNEPTVSEFSEANNCKDPGWR